MPDIESRKKKPGPPIQIADALRITIHISGTQYQQILQLGEGNASKGARMAIDLGLVSLGTTPALDSFAPPFSTHMLLRVVASHFVAGAVWKMESGAWHCVRAAPILKWMVGATPAVVAEGMMRTRYQWEWLRDQ
jgi:hypothetical protein